MELRFQDFYGQRVYVHDVTASGNIRIQVKTHSDLNKAAHTPIDQLDIETDISLNLEQAKLLHQALSFMLREELE